MKEKMWEHQLFNWQTRAEAAICVLAGAQPMEACKDKLDVIENVVAEPAKK